MEGIVCKQVYRQRPFSAPIVRKRFPRRFLYKIEVESAPAVEEDAPEPVAVEAEVVEEEVVEVAPEPQVTIEPEVVQEEIVEIMPEPPAPIMEEEVVEIAPEPIVEAEPVEEDVFVHVDSVEEIEAPVEEIVAEPEVIEPVVEEVIEFEPVVEAIVEVIPEAPVEEEIVIAEEPEAVEIEEVWEPVVEAEPEVVAVPEYEPDPVIKEVMGNLAKNISMKIKLVDLLRSGGVKSEILMNSRSEMLERVRYDLGSMEGALYEAKEGLEELDIRRAIEDVSEEEYAAKAPGFQWDIGQYKDEVGKKQAEIYYLEDIKRVMSTGEIVELVELGEGSSEALDELAEIDGHTTARIRVSLEEALACIR